MAKTNRAKKRAHMAAQRAARAEAEALEKRAAQSVDVDDDDLRNFTSEAKWIWRYLNNYVFANGSYYGEPLRHNPSEFTYLQEEGVGHELVIAARRLTVPYCDLKWGSPEHNEHVRASEQALHVRLGETSTLQCGVLELDLQEHGVISKGKYYFIEREDKQKREAPDANFDSVEEAHRKTVTRVGAKILRTAREQIIDESETLKFGGAMFHNYDLSIRAPEGVLPSIYQD